jgi:hypothetical protein
MFYHFRQNNGFVYDCSFWCISEVLTRSICWSVAWQLAKSLSQGYLTLSRHLVGCLTLVWMRADCLTQSSCLTARGLSDPVPTSQGLSDPCQDACGVSALGLCEPCTADRVSCLAARGLSGPVPATRE